MIATALAASFGVFALLTQLNNVWEIAVAGLLEGGVLLRDKPALALAADGRHTEEVRGKGDGHLRRRRGRRSHPRARSWGAPSGSSSG